jgi:hypothetical protein
MGVVQPCHEAVYGAASFLCLEQIMVETGSFFRDEITKCHQLAAKAETESDRVFWLRLARRWVDLLRVQQRGGPNFEAIHKLRFERPLCVKRRAF